jgi:sterol desaturase/sphingolipid hydroxylase (fatty acid hydroxylase superfamily)
VLHNVLTTQPIPTLRVEQTSEPLRSRRFPIGRDKAKMQLGKFGYYTDFVAYPVVVIALTVINFSHPTYDTAKWIIGGAVGALGWTLLEYAIHRVVLHRLPVFSPMHALHHGAPLALLGTPTWVSIPVWFATMLLPLWEFCGHDIATGTTIGVMLGYWWYGIVHHVIHHNRSYSPFAGRRAWHMRHHGSRARGNFGVTTPIWDLVFGTVIESRNSRSTRG